MLSFTLRSAVVAAAAVCMLAAPAAAQSTVLPSKWRRARPDEIPVGQELDVRLQTTLDSETAQVEDRFEATTVVDLLQGDRVLVPAGSIVRGLVRAVDRASRTDRTGELTLSPLTRSSIDGQQLSDARQPRRHDQERGHEGRVGKIAAGAGVGGIVGASSAA